LHLMALHRHGSNNPLGIDKKGPQDTLPFHPYFTIKDLFGLAVFLLIYAFFIFYAPNALGEPDNYIPANPMQTPNHIVPEWYLLPYYAILRSVTFPILFISAKLAGVILAFSAILVLFFLPWLDTSPVRSARFRPIYKWLFWLLVIDVLALGWVGANPPQGIVVTVGQIATLYYFVHMLILFPLLGRIERPRPLPRSIADAVLQEGRPRLGRTQAPAAKS
ncbi:MAG: cytochrome b, partial [Alphaproteobacteria bacterium]|nr:cytochrome b [Alphaproteobacteria bacterium]